MWQIENRTPFGAAGDWIRDREGAETWVVVVRGAFRIESDGTTSIDETQEPPVLAPRYVADPARSSLLYDSDFYLTKPTTDVILHGHAYAPNGRPALQVDVGMRVGEIVKTLRVVGDRIYVRGIAGVTAESPRLFTRMPLCYERTYGGPTASEESPAESRQFEPRNPIGVGFAPIVGTPAPNIEHHSGADAPAGFGPIPPQWVPRVRYAGTYDDAWRHNRMPVYPADLDDRFFMCSPEDQRPKTFLRGGEIVDLVNLTPGGRLTFLLPRLAFRFQTEFRGKSPIVHRGALHTVILEPDVPRVVMVWHTALRAHADVLKLTETSIVPLPVLNPQAGAIPVAPPRTRSGGRA